MAFRLVLGGQHYALDILAGWLAAGIAVGAVAWWERRRPVPG